VVLLTVANLIKKVSIKLMSTHFHKEAHFNRMQEALRKVGGLLESHGWVVWLLGGSSTQGGALPQSAGGAAQGG
jgi:hypothetical protein